MAGMTVRPDISGPSVAEPTYYREQTSARDLPRRATSHPGLQHTWLQVMSQRRDP